MNAHSDVRFCAVAAAIGCDLSSASECENEESEDSDSNLRDMPRYHCRHCFTTCEWETPQTLSALLTVQDFTWLFTVERTSTSLQYSIIHLVRLGPTDELLQYWKCSLFDFHFRCYFECRHQTLWSFAAVGTGVSALRVSEAVRVTAGR